MNMRQGLFLSALAATSFVAGSALEVSAQAPPKNAPPPQAVPRTTKRVDLDARVQTETRFLRSSTIVGTTVALQGGAKFGEVQEFVFTPEGCIDYVIVMHERRFYPIPWVIATFNPAERVILVDVDPVIIRQAPSFTQITQITELNNVQFVEKVRTHFRVDARIRPRPDGDNDRRDGDRRDGDRRDPNLRDRNPTDPAGTRPADPKKPADATDPAAPKKPADANLPADPAKPAPKAPTEPKPSVEPKPSTEKPSADKPATDKPLEKPSVEPKKPLEEKPVPQPK